MGRLGQRKHVSDVQREFSADFTVVNDSLLLCKFCDTVVNWKKKTRIYEHLQTKMHADRKEAKLNGNEAAEDQEEMAFDTEELIGARLFF